MLIKTINKQNKFDNGQKHSNQFNRKNLPPTFSSDVSASPTTRGRGLVGSSLFPTAARVACSSMLTAVLQ